ncbi:MAG: DUF2851 family protein [Kiritimatiellia bacterium]
MPNYISPTAASDGLYREWLGTYGGMVYEPAPDFAYTERHLKCVWYDSRLRPEVLRSARREPVIVESPGYWNLEAGPDFLDAVLLVGPEKRRVTGDIEIHIRPTDWRRHGHAANPAYRNLAAHVTYFSGYLPANELPPGTVQIALQPLLASDPAFAFEHLDVMAYPRAAPDQSPPCGLRLETWDADRIGLLLNAAGIERLRRKAERMAAAIAARGAEQVFYEEFLCALGYKHNRQPFRELAARVPRAALLESTGGNLTAVYALLAGVAGLLPTDAPDSNPEARRYLRELWDCWWKYRDAWEQCILPQSAWRLNGLRPQNHPLRRLMAAAWLFGGGTDLPTLWQRLADAKTPRDALAVLEAVTNLDGNAESAYWHNHLVWGGARQDHPVRILGKARLAAIFMNVIAPFLKALGCGYAPSFLEQAPAEETNAAIRRTARALLGIAHSPQLYRTGLRRQGLLQISSDFCLETRAHCADCRLPTLLKHFYRHP